jgi:hypothetical protein
VAGCIVVSTLGAFRCAGKRVVSFSGFRKVRSSVVVAALLCVAATASAQTTGAPNPTSVIKVAAVNIALGALTAGTWSAARGKPFWPAFARGGAGGAVIFTGKRLLGGGDPLSWWAGREIAALGSSEVVNAAEGLPFLQRVVLPVGPMRFHVDRLAKRKVASRIDIVSTIAGFIVASREGARFALDESLATGVIVFIVPEDSRTVGTHAAGIVTVSEVLPDANFPPLLSKRTVISHEMVHAAQYDFVFTVWSDVAQRAMGRKIPAVGFISRYVDVNLGLPLQLGLNGMIDYEDRPWEREAGTLVKH